jgi:hypothetical protein
MVVIYAYYVSFEGWKIGYKISDEVEYDLPIHKLVNYEDDYVEKSQWRIAQNILPFKIRTTIKIRRTCTRYLSLLLTFSELNAQETSVGSYMYKSRRN